MSLSKVDVGERVSEESKYLITEVTQVTIIKDVSSLQCFHMMGRKHDSPWAAYSTFSQEGTHIISAYILHGGAIQIAIMKCKVVEKYHMEESKSTEHTWGTILMPSSSTPLCHLI